MGVGAGLQETEENEWRMVCLCSVMLATLLLLTSNIPQPLNQHPSTMRLAPGTLKTAHEAKGRVIKTSGSGPT